MRDLILLRGCPGAGKSTWIKERKLSQYTLNRDEICRSCPAYITDPFIFQKPEKIQQIKSGIFERADKILLEKIEARMKNNELVIIDALHLKLEDFTKYEKLINTYSYKVYCIDFSDVPLETCKKQNQLREQKRRVRDAKIEEDYQILHTEKIPEYITKLKPNMFNIKG